jgi:hypothetical protein
VKAILCESRIENGSMGSGMVVRCRRQLSIEPIEESFMQRKALVPAEGEPHEPEEIDVFFLSSFL